jgi:hypothetical protein
VVATHEICKNLRFDKKQIYIFYIFVKREKEKRKIIIIMVMIVSAVKFFYSVSDVEAGEKFYFFYIQQESIKDE